MWISLVRLHDFRNFSKCCSDRPICWHIILQCHGGYSSSSASYDHVQDQPGIPLTWCSVSREDSLRGNTILNVGSTTLCAGVQRGQRGQRGQGRKLLSFSILLNTSPSGWDLICHAFFAMMDSIFGEKNEKNKLFVLRYACQIVWLE